MDLEWLTICAEGATDPCVSTVQLAYLVGVLAVLVFVGFVAARSRDLSTATLALLPVAIAINIAIGAIVVVLRLPIYLDSVGTVLVGVVAGPWAGALTGLLSNVIWSILPLPGGAGPTIAFFAPVAGVIGFMAGLWAQGGVFRLRADDERVGVFLALAAGVATAAIGFLVINQLNVLPSLDIADPANPTEQENTNQLAFVTQLLGLIALGAVVAWLSRRSVFAFREPGAPIARYLAAATGIAAGAFMFALLRLLFAPNGWFATIDGTDPNPDDTLGAPLGGANLTGLALPDPQGLWICLGIAVVVGVLAWLWARRGENSRLFPVWVGGLTTGLVAAAISAPIAAGVFGGVTGAGTDLLVSIYRTLGLNVLQSAFAQGLTSDPLDKTISYTIVYLILGALPITMRTMYSRGESTVAE